MNGKAGTLSASPGSSGFFSAAGDFLSKLGDAAQTNLNTWVGIKQQQNALAQTKADAARINARNAFFRNQAAGAGQSSAGGIVLPVVGKVSTPVAIGLGLAALYAAKGFLK